MFRFFKGKKINYYWYFILSLLVFVVVRMVFSDVYVLVFDFCEYVLWERNILDVIVRVLGGRWFWIIEVVLVWWERRIDRVIGYRDRSRNGSGVRIRKGFWYFLEVVEDKVIDCFW